MGVHGGCCWLRCGGGFPLSLPFSLFFLFLASLEVGLARGRRRGEEILDAPRGWGTSFVANSFPLFRFFGASGWTCGTGFFRAAFFSVGGHLPRRLAIHTQHPHARLGVVELHTQGHVCANSQAPRHFAAWWWVFFAPGVELSSQAVDRPVSHVVTVRARCFLPSIRQLGVNVKAERVSEPPSQAGRSLLCPIDSTHLFGTLWLFS